MERTEVTLQPICTTKTKYNLKEFTICECDVANTSTSNECDVVNTSTSNECNVANTSTSNECNVVNTFCLCECEYVYETCYGIIRDLDSTRLIKNLTIKPDPRLNDVCHLYGLYDCDETSKGVTSYTTGPEITLFTLTEKSKKTNNFKLIMVSNVPINIPLVVDIDFELLDEYKPLLVKHLKGWKKYLDEWKVRDPNAPPRDVATNYIPSLMFTNPSPTASSSPTVAPITSSLPQRTDFTSQSSNLGSNLLDAHSDDLLNRFEAQFEKIHQEMQPKISSERVNERASSSSVSNQLRDEMTRYFEAVTASASSSSSSSSSLTASHNRQVRPETETEAMAVFNAMIQGQREAMELYREHEARMNGIIQWALYKLFYISDAPTGSGSNNPRTFIQRINSPETKFPSSEWMAVLADMAIMRIMNQYSAHSFGGGVQSHPAMYGGQVELTPEADVERFDCDYLFRVFQDTVAKCRSARRRFLKNLPNTNPQQDLMIQQDFIQSNEDNIQGVFNLIVLSFFPPNMEYNPPTIKEAVAILNNIASSNINNQNTHEFEVTTTSGEEDHEYVDVERPSSRRMTSDEFRLLMVHQKYEQSDKVVMSKPSANPLDEKSVYTWKDLFSTECAICLENFQKGEDVAIMKCRHVLHDDCGKQLFCVGLHTCFKCPTCDFEL